MSAVSIVLLFLSTIAFSNCSRILAFVAFPLASHQNAHHRLWQELSTRGHEVTLFLPDPRNDPKYPNLTEISLHGAYEVLKKSDFDKIVMTNDIHNLLKLCPKLTEFVYTHPEVQRIMHEEKGKYDVFIVEGYFLELFMIGKQLDVPIVTITSTDTVHHKYIGNPTHPLLHLPLPEIIKGQLGFQERLMVFLFTLLTTPAEVLMSLDAETVRNVFGNEASFDLHDLVDLADINLINVNPIFLHRIPLAPNTIVIGGGNHLTPPRRLPEDIMKFIESSKNGVIYVAFGSSVNTAVLPTEKVNAMLDVFKDLPYNIIWKFNEKDLPASKPPNVMTLSWAPQQDILRHNKTKLYITHGGIQSVEEALYLNVPMVCLPFFADQEQNGYTLQRMELLRVVEHNPTLDKEIFKSTIMEVLDNNELYRNRIRETLELFTDKPVSGLDLAIWWIEYVIRHKGAKHLRVPRLPTYQHYFLDVIAFLLVMSVIVLSTLYVCIKTLLRKTCDKKRVKTN